MNDLELELDNELELELDNELELDVEVERQAIQAINLLDSHNYVFWSTSDVDTSLSLVKRSSWDKVLIFGNFIHCYRGTRILEIAPSNELGSYVAAV